MDGHKYDNICFCCLAEEGHLKNMLEEVFITAKIKVQFVQGYTVCSGISPDEKTTKNICLTCATKLKSSYEFRELCRASYRTLQQRSERIAEMCVDVKHEVPSDTEAEIIVYGISGKEGKESDPSLFSQVYVRDAYSETSTKLVSQVEMSKPSEGFIEELGSSNDDVQDVVDDTSDEISHKLKRHKKSKRAERMKRRKLHDSKKIPMGVDAGSLDANFICYHCDIYLQSHNEFLKHREQHKNGNAYQKLNRFCNICNEEVQHYMRHIEDCHKDYKPNTCNYCAKGSFQTSSELKSHLFTHVKCEPTHVCMTCNEKFRNEVSLRSHITNHRNINNHYFCPYCGLEYSRFTACRDHFNSSHDPSKKLFPCFLCKRIYMVGKYYDDHECQKADAKVTTSISFATRCDTCSLPFSCDDELECHRARGCLADPEVNKCTICAKEFETRSKLMRHMKSHDPKRRLFVCDQCGHGSMSESQMKLHKFMHVTDRPFQCQLCPATFKLDQHLKGHQKVHKPAPFECYLCEKKFRTYDNIRLHMGTHSNASVLRRFTCELCGKTSVSGTALGRHMKTHTHEKNVKCDLCDRTFRDIGGVNKHYRKVHEGLFYECKFCGKTYKEKMKFRNHLYVHRGFKPFHCPVCPSQHVEKYIFIKHLRGQHNIQFVEKIHGYRETENINALIEECQRIPFRKGDAPSQEATTTTTTVPTSAGTTVTIEEDAQNSYVGLTSTSASMEVGTNVQSQPYCRPIQFENKY